MVIKTAINPKSDDKCFQYAITVVLNHKNAKNDLVIIPNVKSFINEYNWKEINFLSHVKGWKKCEPYNQKISLNILFVENNQEEIKQAYISKRNSDRENKAILLIIIVGEK